LEVDTVVFKLSNTFPQPTNDGGAQRGFPAPGQGAQSTGAPVTSSPGSNVAWYPANWARGIRSWLNPGTPAGEQRGTPSPQSVNQRRPSGSMPNIPPIFGGHRDTVTPFYDRGAAAVVPFFGKVLTNPIGAGNVVLSRPMASYGGSPQYQNGAIWWTSQAIPTSLNLAGLTSAAELNALLGNMKVYGEYQVG